MRLQNSLQIETYLTWNKFLTPSIIWIFFSGGFRKEIYFSLWLIEILKFKDCYFLFSTIFTSSLKSKAFSVAFPKFPVDYFRNTARRYVYQRRTQNRVKHLRWNFTKIVIRRNLFQKFNMELFAQIVSGWNPCQTYTMELLRK